MEGLSAMTSNKDDKCLPADRGLHHCFAGKLTAQVPPRLSGTAQGSDMVLGYSPHWSLQETAHSFYYCVSHWKGHSALPPLAK